MKFLFVLPAIIAVAYASLAQDLEPALALLRPTTEGVDAGLQQGAGNVKAALQNAGVALDQVGNGLADVAANTVAGLGQTVVQVPGRTLQLIKALENGGGPVGSLIDDIFGK